MTRDKFEFLLDSCWISLYDILKRVTVFLRYFTRRSRGNASLRVDHFPACNYDKKARLSAYALEYMGL